MIHLNTWSQTHLVFLCCAHIFFSVERQGVGSVLGTMQRNITENIVSLRRPYSELPDSPSEAILQWRGANIKDVNLGEPGVDARHLSKQRRTLRVHLCKNHFIRSSNHRNMKQKSIWFLCIPYRWLLLLHLVIVVLLFPWLLRSLVTRKRQKSTCIDA